MVPFTMPITRDRSRRRSDSRSGRMMRDAAGDRRFEQQVDAGAVGVANSSSPTLASSSLLAVTTGLPWLEALEISSRAGSIPPITSTTMSISGSTTTEWASVGEYA